MSRNILKSTAIALALGMKTAETEMLTSYASPMSKEIVQQKQNHVLQDVLDGKFTKQVQEYRYRHYLILREASKKMRAKERREIWHLKVDPYDSYRPEMGIIVKNTIAGMCEDNVEKRYSNILFENTSCQVPIEKYSNKLVVRDINGTHKLLEVHFHKYQPENGASTYVISELNKLIDNPQLTPLTNINKIGFVTNSVIGDVDDFLYFEYKILSLYKVVEWNNNIIIKYIAEPTVNGEDILKSKYYDSDVDTQIMSQKMFPTTMKQLSRTEELLLENERLKQENLMLKGFH
jgi:hypothetical protein